MMPATLSAQSVSTLFIPHRTSISDTLTQTCQEFVLYSASRRYLHFPLSSELPLFRLQYFLKYGYLEFEPFPCRYYLPDSCIPPSGEGPTEQSRSALFRVFYFFLILKRQTPDQIAITPEML
jgi:hypothetical protein